MTDKPKDAPKVIIVGAGITGLAAAHWLDEKGYDVNLFEASDHIGGRALTIKRPGSNDVVDVGTQYFHSNYHRIKKLIHHCGLHDDITKIKGNTLFFDERVKGGSFQVSHRIPYFASGTLMQNLTLILKSLGRLGRHFVNPYAVLPDCKIDHQLAHDAMPDPFEFDYIARSTIAVGSLEEPFEKPVSYLHVIRLMRIIGMTDYLSLNGGIASLHQKLAQSLNIETKTSVMSLKQEADRINGVVLEDGRVIEADHVIIATPPEAALKIIPEDWHSERTFLKSIRRPPAVIVTLFLKKRLECDVWSYMFRANLERLVSFCVDTARKNPAMAKSGLSSLQAWICSPAAQNALDLSDEALLEAVVAELSELFPTLEDDIESHHIHRLAHSVPQAPVGHNKQALEFLQHMDVREGIELCGDYLSGGYAECGAWAAERAVKRISE